MMLGTLYCVMFNFLCVNLTGSHRVSVFKQMFLGVSAGVSKGDYLPPVSELVEVVKQASFPTVCRHHPIH